ncbi:MAG: radical SAM protein [Nitrospira sp.]
MFEKLSAPLMSTIDITDHCNLTCSYCYAHNGNSVFMARDLVVDTAKQLHGRGVWQIVLGGGEPFLHPEIIPILTELLGAGITLGVITNGTTLGTTVLNKIQGLFSKFPNQLHIQVSIDSVKPEINDRLRGLGHKALLAANELAKRSVSVSTGTVLHKYNVAETHLIIEYFYPHIKKFHYMNLMPSYLVKMTKEDLFPAPEELAGAYSRLRSCQQKYPDTIITFPDLQAIISDKQSPSLSCVGCTAGITRMDINARGDLLACNIADGSRFGNLSDGSIWEAWDSVFVDSLRASNEALCMNGGLIQINTLKTR